MERLEEGEERHREGKVAIEEVPRVDAISERIEATNDCACEL